MLQRQAGRLAGWQAGRLAGWQAGRLAGRQAKSDNGESDMVRVMTSGVQIALSVLLIARPARSQTSTPQHAAKPGASTNAWGEQAHVNAPLGKVRRFAGDGKGAFATGRYRNLFVEQLGKTGEETRAKIEQAFDRFFHGDGQEERVYFETGENANGTLAYVTDWARCLVPASGGSGLR
jgi:hypothetical protein